MLSRIGRLTIKSKAASTDADAPFELRILFGTINARTICTITVACKMAALNLQIMAESGIPR